MICDVNICKICRNAKDRFRESCYCVQYGIIVTYGKSKCKGYKPMTKKEMEELNREQTDNNRKSRA